ncbi:hypothetical protein [Terricaulis sp.]|uniref:hypothetical protein n=1 Tax=Terricaulis sp. TaxID=2768686 RepID=UPI002AC6435B|nr:hypothetical protein [Terricaulis sp.]MDZ4693415.1 hypothetical protein [Terricaulis sp.]
MTNSNWGPVTATTATSANLNIADYMAPPAIIRGELAERCRKAWRVADSITRAAAWQLEPRGSSTKYVMMASALNTAVNEIVGLLEAGAGDHAIYAANGFRILCQFEVAQAELFALVD